MKSAVFLYNAQSGRGRIRRNVERVCDVFREGATTFCPCPSTSMPIRSTAASRST